MGRQLTGREASALAALAVLVGSISLQFGSSIASGLFATYSPIGTSSTRMLLAAAILLLIFRPRIRGRSIREWLALTAFGVSMAAMNMSVYSAIDRLPLGIAVTLNFLGPCAVALYYSRKVKEFIAAGGTLLGVALISFGPGGYFDALGYAFGLCAATFFALYTVCADKIGSKSGLEGLALSVTIAALVTLPISLPHIPQVTAVNWGWLALSALTGVVITYGADTLAGKLTSARVIGTLFAFDPVTGSIIGYLVLGEAMRLTTVLGIMIVAACGAAIVWFGKEDQTPVAPDLAATPR